MKTVTYTSAALADLAKHKNRAAKIMDKVDRYAATGAGDVKQLVGSPAKRLRVGDFRVIFEEAATTITVSRIAPRGGVYD
ncbi:type II toxin-antitoxin system RelE family toxin [Bosea vestrisii]|uniref:Type II toxin-antitoxin system RelE/ParE family toxin n=1 Tax=Bosea vestrisii TaxID=151416 RepID=A0ABW0H5K4_9HYPH